MASCRRSPKPWEPCPIHAALARHGESRQGHVCSTRDSVRPREFQQTFAKMLGGLACSWRHSVSVLRWVRKCRNMIGGMGMNVNPSRLDQEPPPGGSDRKKNFRAALIRLPV